MSRYEQDIYQVHRWGPLKWYGNIIQYAEGDAGSPFESIGTEEEQGWFSWTRSGVERKTRRAIRRYKREEEWRPER